MISSFSGCSSSCDARSLSLRQWLHIYEVACPLCNFDDFTLAVSMRSCSQFALCTVLSLELWPSF